MNNSNKGSFPPLRDDTESKVEVDVDAALKLKLDNLTRELREIDATISQVNEEYSAKLEQLQVRKKPMEEALHHIEALLRLEGYPMDGFHNGVDINETVSATRKDPVVDAAFNLLQELSQPMHYKDMASNLHERNIYIPGKDPAATLLSRMSRDNRFKRAKKRGVYALSTWRVRSLKPKSTKVRKPRKR